MYFFFVFIHNTFVIVFSVCKNNEVIPTKIKFKKKSMKLVQVRILKVKSIFARCLEINKSPILYSIRQ